MYADSRSSALEWAGALVAALLLHAALVAGLPSTPAAVGDTATRLQAGRDGEARVRLSLHPGEPATPAAAAPLLRATPAELEPSVHARVRDEAPLPAPPRPALAPVALPAPVAEALPETVSDSPPETVSDSPPETVSDALPAAGEPGAGDAADLALADVAAAGSSGRAPGSPGSEPALSGRGAGSRGDYFGSLVEKVNAALSYPRRARLERVEGSVVLAVRIERDGALAGCQVLESSGSRLLDREALRSAARAAPFGAVPAQLSDAELEFELPLDFVLTD